MLYAVLYSRNVVMNKTQMGSPQTVLRIRKVFLEGPDSTYFRLCEPSFYRIVY